MPQLGMWNKGVQTGHNVIQKGPYELKKVLLDNLMQLHNPLS